MHFDLERPTILVAVGTPLSLSDGLGRSLRVVQGRIWVTQEGSLDDLFLDAGQSCTFESAGSIVLTAEGVDGERSTVCFDEPLSIRSRPSYVRDLLRRLAPPTRIGALA